MIISRPTKLPLSGGLHSRSTYWIALFFVSGKGWSNWSLVVVYSVSIPFLALFREQYKRLDIDTGI